MIISFPDPFAALAGALVGALVGLTGVGGGSLMTPLLVFAFGHAPAAAVGTDLLFACGTKLAGTATHGFHGDVDWRVVARLTVGGIPAALLTLALMAWAGMQQTHPGWLLIPLGVMLMLTGISALGWLRGSRSTVREGRELGQRWPVLTVVAGAVIGALVALTSIGAGALGVSAIRALHPQSLSGARAVGTDLAWAIPLTLVCGLGHLWMGNLDVALLTALLCGSLPAVVVSSWLAPRLAAGALRRVLGVLLLIVGFKTIWSCI